LHWRLFVYAARAAAEALFSLAGGKRRCVVAKTNVSSFGAHGKASFAAA
jgi:hypothetical protein